MIRQAAPMRCAGPVIVGVVEAYARNWPTMPPPLFRSADVLPLLHGDDREFTAASTLLDAERVHYPEGTPE
ncbi:hypothetical protein [Nocardia cyriacigeorgica]|uniref:hypothetical protein n=1 Tax=Nocardia cyriacigeorgica TaxID=135487 RepID=UPI0018935F6C|nr:hypothetical protein [Nocardia cyriacigeorgica]MBF6289296.1 hypothetical protein [Nocardia cyriacigeorgica]